MSNRLTMGLLKPRRLQCRTLRVGKLECLEPRLLLYAPNGGVWPHPELVTVSFMPDGTDLGGVPSSLFSTMNARWSSATWQKEMLRGLQNYAANSNLNFTVVTDDGSAFGNSSDCKVQGSSHFGDIRIGAYDMGSNLGVGLLAPPINGDTTAGDFFLNSTTTWNIGSSYDLQTVTAHEAGHALGLDHSTSNKAVMYASYTGVKSSLNSDDITGIHSIYDTRHKDGFDAIAPNDSRSTATVITPLIDSNKQVNLSARDITTTSDVDYYKITIPSGAAGTMTVQMQSQGFSLLAPLHTLYNYSGKQISSTSGNYGSTLHLTQSISKDQVYFIKAAGADTSVFGTGTYALQVNLGSSSLPTLTGPNTETSCSGTGGSGTGYDPPDRFVGKGKAHFYSADGTGDIESSGHVVISISANQTANAAASPAGNDSATELDEDAAGLSGLISSGSSRDGAEHSHRQWVLRPTERRLRVTIDGSIVADKVSSSGIVVDDDFEAHAIDHIFEVNPVDVIRPGFALVCELANN